MADAVLPVNGGMVRSFNVDGHIVIMTVEAAAGPFTFMMEEIPTLSRPGAATLSLDTDEIAGVIPDAWDLVGQHVEAGVARRTGELNVRFSDGAVLEVGRGEQFEAWTMLGPNGMMIIAIPDGGLAEWDPVEE